YNAAVSFARAGAQSSWVPYGNGANYSGPPNGTRKFGETFPNPDLIGTTPPDLSNYVPPLGINPDGTPGMAGPADAGVNPGHSTVVPTYKCPSDWRSLIASVDIWGSSATAKLSAGQVPTCFTSYSGNAGHKGNIDYHSHASGTLFVSRRPFD